LAETAITDAKAFTDREAIDGRLCDLVATSRDDLLRQLDGRAITRFDRQTTRLTLGHSAITSIDMSARERFLSRIVQPDMFFLLLLVGAIGLYTEITHPGLVLPGVMGAIAALLALFATHLLPISVTLLLLVLAMALFVLEAKYTSHGVLGTGGVVAMLFGALILVRSPLTGAGVSLGAALGATLPYAAITILLMRLVLRSRAWTPQTGIEALVHENGTVKTTIGGTGDTSARGMVQVHGELWQAIAPGPIPAGARVRVLRANGLILEVEPFESPTRTGRHHDGEFDEHP
jgi:membrane-bound serine protease (ClpP class)